MQYFVNRREFGRVNFKEPIMASIERSTSSFHYDINAIGEAVIYVIDMSAGGLRFVSKTEFMVNFLTLYKIKLKINSKDIVVLGKIIRKRKLMNHFFEYGVQFYFRYNEQKS